ncbi:MAG: ribonuclease P protein component [Tissierellia bacterium]|nr:ribonuclease P protein component [Tissierellia bacterium]
MKKKYILKSYFDFKKVYEKKQTKGNRQMVLYIKPNGKDFNRLGLTVSKKVGNAVVRNLLRRRMKEIYRENSNNLKTGYDLVFVLKPVCADISYRELRKSFLHVIKLSKLKR